MNSHKGPGLFAYVVSAAIPFYPETTTVTRLSKRFHVNSFRIIRAVDSLHQQDLICQEGSTLTKLRRDW